MLPRSAIEALAAKFLRDVRAVLQRSPDALLSLNQTAEMVGCTRETLSRRYAGHPRHAFFPKPDVIRGRRPFWKRSTVVEALNGGDHARKS